MEGLTRIYDEKAVLENIWLSFYPGAKIGVLGSNGSGKSTLLKIMAGEDKDFMGTATPAKGIKIGYFSQEPHLDPEMTVDQCVEQGVAESRAILDRYNEINEKFGEEMTPEEMEKLIEEQASVQDKIDHANLWELDRQLELAADALRLPPGEARVAHLSGGEKRRVALCQLLLRNPDMLLLDEPTNHLDLHHQIELTALFARMARELGKTVVMVLHDVNLAARCADHALLLHGAGEVTAGPCAQILKTPQLERLYRHTLRQVGDDPPAWLPG